MCSSGSTISVVMRRLKFHEKKLLKKVNFLEWKRETGHREARVTRKYQLVDRDDYKKYNVICGMTQTCECSEADGSKRSISERNDRQTLGEAVGGQAMNVAHLVEFVYCVV